ncbi:hypothetical protein TEA_000099 [Camellia sinensis var. sinensis]|uniref:Rhodanese domain-containing protein n=1 Tax=Camellia sinensis var. sinensis TaxID=542762 RepID=A0A4S4E3N4_CAMSN|nr:hypothetical protein TEA_000099 [Camellia sinensis var. sinensis]
MESNGGDASTILRELENLKSSKIEIERRISVLEAQLRQKEDETKGPRPWPGRLMPRAGPGDGDCGRGDSGVVVEVRVAVMVRGAVRSDIGQSNLLKTSILVVGAGGLGSPALLYLAACGVGRLGIVDHDIVELNDLHRQIIRTEVYIGQSKVESAAAACRFPKARRANGSDTVSAASLYVVCRRGNDSQRAIKYLRKMGFASAKDIDGGLESWARDVIIVIALLERSAAPRCLMLKDAPLFVEVRFLLSSAKHNFVAGPDDILGSDLQTVALQGLCLFHELEKEAEAAEAHVQFEEVPTEKVLAIEEVVAGGELKEKRKNMLYNLTVELEIPGLQKIPLHAILDTGATTCVVDSESVPAEALEENTYTVEFNGINSKS